MMYLPMPFTGLKSTFVIIPPPHERLSLYQRGGAYNNNYSGEKYYSMKYVLNWRFEVISAIYFPVRVCEMLVSAQMYLQTLLQVKVHFSDYSPTP